MLRRQATTAGCSRWLVRMTKGRSDQGGCRSIQCASGRGILPEQALLGEKHGAHAGRHLADQFRRDLDS